MASKDENYDVFISYRHNTSVTILEGMKSIGDWAFAYCTGLTSVTIPEGVTSIGESAFWGCDGLREIDIPDRFADIGIFGLQGFTESSCNKRGCIRWVRER